MVCVWKHVSDVVMRSINSPLVELGGLRFIARCIVMSVGHEYVLVLWNEDSRGWLFPREIKMQLPKAIKVANEDEAKMVVEVYNRALLFLVGAGTESDPFMYLRVSPSGKVENLTDKVHKAYALVTGSSPLKQGELDGVSKEAKSSRKPA